MLNIFSRAAHAPKMNLFVNAALLGFIPKSVKKGLMALAPVRRIRNAVMKDLGLPDDIMTFVNYPTRFDSRETQAALKGSGIEVPEPEGLRLARCGTTGSATSTPTCTSTARLRGTVAGKVVLVTGGSSGIGLAAAHKFAEAGAHHRHLRARPGQAATKACARGQAPGATSSSPTRSTSPTWPTATASSSC